MGMPRQRNAAFLPANRFTFPEVISKKDRKGRKEGSVITDSKAIVCEAIKQLNSWVNLSVSPLILMTSV